MLILLYRKTTRIYCSLVVLLWILIRQRSWNSNQAFHRSQTFPSLPQFTRKKRKEGRREGRPTDRQSTVKFMCSEYGDLWQILVFQFSGHYLFPSSFKIISLNQYFEEPWRSQYSVSQGHRVQTSVPVRLHPPPPRFPVDSAGCTNRFNSSLGIRLKEKSWLLKVLI